MVAQIKIVSDTSETTINAVNPDIIHLNAYMATTCVAICNYNDVTKSQALG